MMAFLACFSQSVSQSGRMCSTIAVKKRKCNNVGRWMNNHLEWVTWIVVMYNVKNLLRTADTWHSFHPISVFKIFSRYFLHSARWITNRLKLGFSEKNPNGSYIVIRLFWDSTFHIVHRLENYVYMITKLC